MTYNSILKLAKTLGKDAIVWASNDKISVDLNDFVGFDDEWNEIFCDFDNEEAVDSFLETLRNEAVKVIENLYTTYYFDGFTVQVGYTSYDI